MNDTIFPCFLIFENIFEVYTQDKICIIPRQSVNVFLMAITHVRWQLHAILFVTVESSIYSKRHAIIAYIRKLHIALPN